VLGMAPPAGFTPAPTARIEQLVRSLSQRQRARAQSSTCVPGLRRQVPIAGAGGIDEDEIGANFQVSRICLLGLSSLTLGVLSWTLLPPARCQPAHGGDLPAVCPSVP